MTTFVQKAVEHIRNNLTALKHYILFAATDGVPIFMAWKNICYRYGQDAMEYPDFEFWYMRFARGEFDMDYDRSQEPKRPGLLNLPLDVLEMIGQKLDLMERRVLRKVNKFFHGFIGGWDPEFKYISIVVEHDRTKVWFDEHHIVYSHESFYDTYNYYVPLCNVSYRGKSKKIVNANHVDMAFQDVTLILKNRKLKMTKFYVEFKTGNINEDALAEHFKAMNCKIKTPTVHISTLNGRGEMAVLPYLEAGTLREVNLELEDTFMRFTKEEYTNRLGAIGLLEQCQLAESVKFHLTRGEPGWFPLESFSGCSNVVVDFKGIFSVQKVSVADVLKFKKALLHPNTNLTRFHFLAKHDFGISTLRRRLTGKTTIDVPNESNIKRFKVPKSKETLEMDFRNSVNYVLDLVMTRKVLDS